MTLVSCSRGGPAAKSTTVAPPAAAARTPTIDYFQDAAALASLIKAKYGDDVPLREIVLHQTTASAEVRSPDDPHGLDSILITRGAIGEPRPLDLTGSPRSADGPDAALFKLSEVDFAQVARMIADAPAQAQIEGGKVTHLIVHRQLPFHTDVRWRLFVKGPRGSESVDYTLAGAKVESK